jgi:hypothetical protein
MYANGKPNRQDRAHERRDQHRADDDGRRVGVETDARDEDRADKHPDIMSPEDHVLSDGFDRAFDVGVGPEVQYGPQ